MTTLPAKFTHRTPSGILVYIVAVMKSGWMLMSNGAIIDADILKKWELPEKKAGEK